MVKAGGEDRQLVMLLHLVYGMFGRCSGEERGGAKCPRIVRGAALELVCHELLGAKSKTNEYRKDNEEESSRWGY